jgi:hypothetical protein
MKLHYKIISIIYRGIPLICCFMITVVVYILVIQFNLFIAKLNSPEANYKVSTGKKMRRVRSKKVSENNVLMCQYILNICSFVRQCNTFTSQTLSRHVSASQYII